MSPYFGVLMAGLALSVFLLVIVGLIGVLSFLRRRRADTHDESTQQEMPVPTGGETPALVNPLVRPAEPEPAAANAILEEVAELPKEAEIAFQIDMPDGPNDNERTIQRLIDYLER